MTGTSETFEDDELELVGVENLQILGRRLEEFREIVPQKGEFQICRDTDRFGQPIPYELFDDAIWHDNRDRVERVAPLLRCDRLCQRRNQVFESIGVVEANHCEITMDRRSGFSNLISP